MHTGFHSSCVLGRVCNGLTLSACCVFLLLFCYHLLVMMNDEYVGAGATRTVVHSSSLRLLSSRMHAHTIRYTTIMVYAPDNKYLLLRRGPTAPVWPLKWNMPGGTIDDTDATPLDAALRECKEEAGESIVNDIYKTIPLGPYNCTDFACERWAVFVGLLRRPSTEQQIALGNVERHSYTHRGQSEYLVFDSPPAKANSDGSSNVSRHHFRRTRWVNADAARNYEPVPEHVEYQWMNLNDDRSEFLRKDCTPTVAAAVERWTKILRSSSSTEATAADDEQPPMQERPSAEEKPFQS